MRDQACKYGAKIETEFVTKLERDEETGLFTATWGSGCATARTVLLATGVTNRRPPMDEELHDDALARGLIRYCPICDGYEVTDKKVGVIGSDSHGVAEALFLRSYTADVTLIAPDKAMRLKPEDQREAEGRRHRLRRRAGPGGRDRRRLHHRRHRRGPSHLRQHLSRRWAPTPTRSSPKWSARTCRSDCCIMVDSHQRTSVAGLYAAGDVVIGLDQISHAMGEGGVAATTIRNDLCAKQPHAARGGRELEEAETGT